MFSKYTAPEIGGGNGCHGSGGRLGGRQTRAGRVWALSTGLPVPKQTVRPVAPNSTPLFWSGVLSLRTPALRAGSVAGARKALAPATPSHPTWSQLLKVAC